MNHKHFQHLIGDAHSRMIEIPIKVAQNAQTQIKFDDQPDLRYARITALETYTYADMQTTQPSNYTMINGVDLSKISVVLETNDPDDIGHWLTNDAGQLVSASGQVLLPGQQGVWKPAAQSLGNGRFTSTQQNQKYLPLASMHYIQNQGSTLAPIAGPDPFTRQRLEFTNMYVSWDKCFLQIVNGGLGNSVDKAVGIMVYYTWLDINGKRIQRT